MAFRLAREEAITSDSYLSPGIQPSQASLLPQVRGALKPVGANSFAKAMAHKQRGMHERKQVGFQAASLWLWLWLLILIFSAPLNHAGRKPILIRRANRQDAGLAAPGQGWPFAAARRINVGLRACRA